MNHAIASQRLHNQYITRTGPPRPEQVVSWLGAVQAQEYLPAKWALALRMPAGVTEPEIEQALSEGRILRTHVLRPTWHFVSPADIRWMLELSAANVHRRMSPYDRQLGLDLATKNRAAAVFERALADGKCLIRGELRAELERGGIAASSYRLGHLALYAELEGIMCSGPRRGKQFTYASLASRVPRTAPMSRDEALAELTRRYVNSHGPATHRDFAWWSGLPAADAKRGLDMIGARRQLVDGSTYWTADNQRKRAAGKTLHLLPIYDEYLVAYRDRQAVPHTSSMAKSSSGGYSTFRNALVIAAQIAGTWKTVQSKNATVLQVTPQRRLTRAEQAALAEETQRYARFLARPVRLSVA